MKHASAGSGRADLDVGVPAQPGEGLARLAANAREAVEAEVMPEHITVKADQEGEEVQPERLMGVERRTGGLGVLGDQFQVGERGERATMKAIRNGSQTTPPTSLATLPVTA